MGRKRIRPLSYAEITEQTEKTITMLMRPVHVAGNSETSKREAFSRALGAFILWQDLVEKFGDTDDDKERLLDLLSC